MADDAYTFGDSPLAATRLALLSEVFREATERFLVALAGPRPRFAVDLGCGPGFTTELLDEVIAPTRVMGVDSSAAFAGEAARRLGSRGEVLCGDVLDLPGQVCDADLIFARFLLTHLAGPATAIEHWLDRLSPTGRLAVQEVESVATDEPTLASYLDLQRRMLQSSGHRLDIGPEIAEAGRMAGALLRDGVARVTPSTSAAARMFAMNFAGWRTRPVVAELASVDQLGEIERGLDGLAAADRSDASITWELREVVLGGRRGR